MTKMRCIANKVFYTANSQDQEFDLPLTVGKEYHVQIIDFQMIIYTDNKKFEPITVPRYSDITIVDLLNCFCPV